MPLSLPVCLPYNFLSEKVSSSLGQTRIMPGLKLGEKPLAVKHSKHALSLHLRRRVKWHDGQPLTAADVKVSLDRVTSPDFRSLRCGTMLTPLVERTDIMDEHTVKLRLKFATPSFLPTLASAWCRV